MYSEFGGYVVLWAGLALVLAGAWLFALMLRAERRLSDLERSFEAAAWRGRDSDRVSSLLAKRLDDLTSRVEAVERQRLETGFAPVPAPPLPPAIVAATRAEKPAPRPPITPAPLPGTAPAAVRPPLFPAATRAIEPPPRPSADAQDLGEAAPVAALTRWLFGGNTIVKVGVGILFIGLAFLAKFASEHVRVPIEVRLSSIGGAALVLLAIGWRLRERRAGYAQVLQGGAVAVLYLTLFVAFRFYTVLAVGPVFGLMVAVAVLAAALAVLQDSPALAVVGMLGGFATPLLVSTGSGNYVALFSYYLVLDLGIAAVAWHKTWKPLNLVGFFFTFVVATAWGALQYNDANYASSQAFLAAFFLVFVVIMLMPARRHPAGGGEPGAETWVNGTLLFGLPTITFVLQYGLVRHTEYGVALSALVMAAFYVLLAVWMRSRPRVVGLIFEGSLAVGTVFVTLTIPFALDARSTAGAWALEGAALVWLGFRQARIPGRLLGYLLLLVSGVILFVKNASGSPADGVFNATLFNSLLLAAASLTGAWLVRRFTAGTGAAAPAMAADEKTAEPLLVVWATLWLAFCAGVEIDAFVPPPYQPAVWIASLGAMALVLTGLSVWQRWRMVAVPAALYAPLLFTFALASAASGRAPVESGGWWAWPLALVVHLVVLSRATPRWPDLARKAAHLLGVLVLAILGALEGRDVTSRWGDYRTAWSWLGWLAVPAGLLLLLPRPAAARAWPVSAAVRTYQTGAAGVLTCCALLWVLVANIVSDGAAVPLPYVPLVNPLDLGVAIALFAAWRWRESEGGRAAPGQVSRLVFLAVACNAFVWLNAILIRAFHHVLGVPFNFDAWTASLAVQTGISLLWTATALVLMWGAARRAIRAPWMAGAALLGAVVVKLIAVDLSGSGTVTRIISFIGVGVLMLVIGYVAPLPGKEDADVAR